MSPIRSGPESHRIRLRAGAGENGLNMEADALQLRDKTIVALDTYIMPGKNAGQGIGQLYTSNDNWVKSAVRVKPSGRSSGWTR